MKKLIIKSNKWYDNLPEIKRDIIFVCILFVIIITDYISNIIDLFWLFPLSVFLIVFWRIAYILINEFDNESNTN